MLVEQQSKQVKISSKQVRSFANGHDVGPAVIGVVDGLPVGKGVAKLGLDVDGAPVSGGNGMSYDATLISDTPVKGKKTVRVSKRPIRYRIWRGSTTGE
jgi:hypothetical protein